MERPSAYLPTDRRRAIENGQPLPERAHGAVLFADISGFTPLADGLARVLGPARGAEVLTRLLNKVYDALIGQVECWGGHVIGFSGDAIACWFDGDGNPTSASKAAFACAQAMHGEMHAFHQVDLAGNVAASLAIKTAVTTGPIRRFLVGDPAQQCIDVMAGRTVERMAAAEQLAGQGECVVDETTATNMGAGLDIHSWRVVNDERYAILNSNARGVAEQPRVAEPMPPQMPSTNAEMERQFEAFLDPHVLERIRSGEGRFLAELRPATALFVRFGGLEYDFDEGAPDKLDAYICWVQKVIRRYSGTLIQLTTGDKGNYFYAAFGAPAAHDDDTLAAVAAAIDLHKPPPELSYITDIQIGLSLGMMRVGAYGSANRRTYGVLGEETNAAARLMSKAQPGQTLVSQPVADAVQGRIKLMDLGVFQLKGRAAPQPVFAVVGAAPIDAAVRLSQLYAAPLAGRDKELNILRDALDAAITSRKGRFVCVEGEAGLGKSHLLAAFVQTATDSDVAIALAACQSTLREVAYGAARQIMRTLFGLTDESDVANQTARALDQVRSINPEWLLRAPLLTDLLGAPIPDNAVTSAFDPRLRQEALISLALDLILALARNKPLALLVEDAHWMDEASQGLFLGLTRVAASAPLLLVFAQRPSASSALPFLDALAAMDGRIHLPLDDLPLSGIASLITHRLKDKIEPLALEMIQAQAQGNPFFVEELVDALVEGGRLVHDTGRGWVLSPPTVQKLRDAHCLELVDGTWRLAIQAPIAAANLGVPTSVHGVVLARLDRLPEPVKLTVKVASVIGRSFDLDLLAHVHPQADPAAVRQHLDALLHRDFARLEQPMPRAVYLFKHNIIQEVAYRTLLEDQRRNLHSAVGFAMAAAQPDAVEQLAFHFYRGDRSQPSVRTAALRYLDAAAERARREYVNETALGHLERAIDMEPLPHRLELQARLLHILGQRDAEREVLERLTLMTATPIFDVAMLWGDYFEAMGAYDDCHAWLDRALTDARERGDGCAQGRALSKIGLVQWRQGDYDAAAQIYHQGLTALTATERGEDVESEIRYGLGLVHRQQGDYAEARAEFMRDLQINRGLHNRQNEARALNALGHVESLQRNFVEAMTYYRAALDIRRAIGDRAGVGASTLSMAQTLSSLGDYSQAEPLLQDALAIQQAIGNRWEEWLVWNELGILHWLVGNYPAAVAYLEKGLQGSRAIGSETGPAYILCNLGQVQRDAGDLGRAEETLTVGMALAQDQGDRNLEAIYHTDLALTLLQAGDFARALAEAEMGQAQFVELELELSCTPNLATQAAAHLALGNADAARRCALDAVRLLDGEAGDAADFPQRDYLLCGQALEQLGDDESARHAYGRARAVLMAKAARISDPAMRASYLQNVIFNRMILESTSSPRAAFPDA